ncbi:MAG: RNA polymerase sigma factor [Planctomycetota bacterium]
MHDVPPGPVWDGLVELRTDLENFLAARCRDPHEVDDAVQEALVRAARYRTTLSDPERLRPWLFRIGANVLADRVVRGRGAALRVARGSRSTSRSRSVLRPRSLCDEPETWLGRTPLSLARVRSAIDGAMASLSRNDRAVIRGAYLHGLGRNELARRLGVPPDQVKVRLFRARQKLERALVHEMGAVA